MPRLAIVPSLSLSCAFVVATGSCAVAARPVHALQPNAADSIASAHEARATSPLADLGHLAGAVVHAGSAPLRWDVDGWSSVPALAAGILGLSVLDEDLRDVMRRSQTGVGDGLATFINPFGESYSFAFIAGLYATGLAVGDAKARSVAVEALASSLVAGGLVTPALQLATGRYRPWTGEDPHTWDPFSRNISFPSGHTTQAFAVASVIAARYDSPWVKGVAFSVATAVGLSRMYHDAHYLSDVAAAALIGTAVGTSVARFGKLRRASLTPAVGGNGIGLVVRF